MKRGLALWGLVAVLVLPMTASAQEVTTLVLRTRAGSVYLIHNGQKHELTALPVEDEAIAELPSGEAIPNGVLDALLSVPASTAAPPSPAPASTTAPAPVPAPAAAARPSDAEFLAYMQTKYSVMGNVQLGLRAEKGLSLANSVWIMFKLGNGETRIVLDEIGKWQSVPDATKRTWLLSALKETSDRWPGQDARISVDSEGYTSSTPHFECYMYSSYSTVSRGWFTIWHLASASHSSRGDRIDDRC
jgi:hypothetical protein